MAEGRFIVQFEEKLDVIEEDIAQYSRELLDILLKDRTTNENIIWATSDYISHGELYAATEQIYASLITGVHSKLIQPRVAKAHEQKNSRTRDKAEVFTFNYNAYLHPPTEGLNPQGQVAKNIVAAINANKKCVVVAQNVAVQEIEDSISGFVSITEVSASAVTGLIDTIRMASDDSGRTVFLATASITFKSDGTVTTAAVPYTGRIVMEDALPEYSTEKAPTVSGFAATYYLTRNGNRIGVPINIPLDQVLKSSSIKTVVTANSPYSGAKVGDKYIEFLFQNNNTPQYLPVQDLVDVYTGDDQYIQVTESNVIKLNYSVLSLKLAADLKKSYDNFYDPKGAGEAAAKAAIDEFKASTFVIQCTIPGMN